MTTKTKPAKWKQLSMPLLATLSGLLVVTGISLWGSFDFVSSAGGADIGTFSEDGKNPGLGGTLRGGQIADDELVSVEWVSNKTQYLTALVLHMPESSEVIQLFYDGEGRLRVEGNINADALLIQDKGTINSASTTNANLGGKNNTLKKSTNSAIIGGENNMVNDSYSSIILGGKQSNILKGKNVIFAMADNTTIPSSPTLKKNIFVWGGDGNQIAGGKVAIFSHGGKTKVANDALLIGANIDANGLKNLFVWSDRPNFAPKKSSALYINAKNGLGLNTTKPVVQLDAGNAGGLKMRKANILTHGTAANKGLIVAVEQNGKKGYCGFDGKKWVALDVNPETQNLCSTLGQTSCNGDPQYTLRGSASPATQVWNPQGNLGNGTWEVMPWIYYQKDPGNLGTCEYVCRIGYHPNVNNPSGWFRKSCQLCTEIANRYTAGAHQGWRTAGTGVNNCDFGCKAGFKYRNDTVRACPSCEIGKWTPDNNQEKTCKNCTNKPESLTYRVAEHKYINGVPILSPLQNGTLTNFSNYTTTGTSATSCKWTCDASLGLIPSGSFSAGSLGAGGLTIGGTPWVTNGYCKCKTNTHLEKKDGKVQCVPNTQTLTCEGSKPVNNGNIEFWPSTYTRSGDGWSNKTESQWNWEAKKSWKRVYGLAGLSIGGGIGAGIGNSTSLAPCTFRCKAGTQWNGSSCIAAPTPTYKCTESIPANAEPASDSEDTGLTSNLPWKATTNNTTRKCEFVCKAGYQWNGSACTAVAAWSQCSNDQGSFWNAISQKCEKPDWCSMLYLEQEPKVKNQNGGNISVVTSAVYVSLDENFRNYIDNGGNNLVSEKLKLSNVKYSSQRLCPIDINNRLVYLDSEVYPDSSAFENAVNWLGGQIPSPKWYPDGNSLISIPWSFVSWNELHTAFGAANWHISVPRRQYTGNVTYDGKYTASCSLNDDSYGSYCYAIESCSKKGTKWACPLSCISYLEDCPDVLWI